MCLVVTVHVEDFLVGGREDGAVKRIDTFKDEQVGVADERQGCPSKGAGCMRSSMFAKAGWDWVESQVSCSPQHQLPHGRTDGGKH